ncbi:RNA methyltransferase [Colwellia ponticola]|uniref:RNA methyltransferase n=1 Tax=Colwellia ponticola TaxID=2304625 RepID=A0A8H2JNR4_9GAMM|nr:RNA methyltransferase [Colwellia ponticola]TMM47466.1 RNA methyltransferase [Colwellia ponticola]
MTRNMNDKNHQEKAHISIALTNPKSPTNVGAVMRAAGCYQADQVLYTGRRYEQAAKYNKDTLKTDTKNAQDKIPLVAVDDFINIKDLVENIPKTAKIICVDLVEGAIPLPHFVHPQQAVYIFGPEDGTIKQQVIDCADDVVYVPTVGCMNLAASVNVLLYDRLAKSMVGQNTGQLTDTQLAGAKLADNELIRRSRDTNNTVKVKQC